MSLPDFGMTFDKAEQVGDEIHLVGRDEPRTLILFNALSNESFVFKLFVDGQPKGTYNVGALTNDRTNTGNDGDATVFALFFTCDKQMEAHSDDPKVVYYDNAEATKTVRGEFTSSKGVSLTSEMKVRFA